MNTTIKLIEAAPVQRSEMGEWHHPDMPIFQGNDESTSDSPTWEDWVKEQGLEVSRRSLEDEDDSHPVYQTYFEEQSDPSFLAWEPQPPEGDGWFLLAIGDTEDGPQAWFVRRRDAQ